MIKFFKDHISFILAASVVFAVHLLTINTDFHVLEPDEGIYYGMMLDFYEGRWPLFWGKLYLETFPLFVWLGAKIHIATHSVGPYVSLRVLAMIGIFFSGLSIYLYFLAHKQKTQAVTFTLIFWLIPLVYFYSHTGAYETLFIGLGYLSITTFYLSLKTSNKLLPMLSGVLLTLAILTKTSSAVFLIAFLIFFITSRQQKIRNYLITAATFLTTLAVPYGLFYLKFREEMLYQTQSLPNKHLLPFLNVKVHFATLYIYLTKIPYFLSLPIAIVMVIGIIYLIKHHKCLATSSSLTKLAWILPGAVFISIFDFSPRYFMILVPAIIILIGHLLIKIKLEWLPMLLLVAILPWTYSAFDSTLHTGIRKINQEVKMLQKTHPNLPIYSTVDPEKIGFNLDQEVSYLSNAVYATGGIVIMDKIKTDFFSSLTSPEFLDLKTTQQTLNNLTPVWQYQDPHRHFPGSNQTNTYFIYVIK